MTYPTPSYLNGIWFPSVSALIVSTGGPGNDGFRIARLFIVGPTGSTFRLYISSEHPEYMVSTQTNGKYRRDYSLTGAEDYASYNPSLPVPEGWWLAGAWTGGSTTSTSIGLMTVEYEE